MSKKLSADKIIKKVEAGKKLTKQEAKFFEKLKADHGLNNTGTVPTR